MSRKFFYVCAGLLCLAVAYQLGAQNARASGVLSWAGLGASACGIDAAGHLFAMERDGGPVKVWSYSPPVNGDVVAVESAGDAAYIVKANGDVYRAFVSGQWVLTGNIMSGGPTPANRNTWGDLKAWHR